MKQSIREDEKRLKGIFSENPEKIDQEQLDFLKKYVPSSGGGRTKKRRNMRRKSKRRKSKRRHRRTKK